VANASRPSGRQIGRAPADRASWYGRPPRSVRAAVDSLRRRVGDSDPAFVERAALNPCLLDAAQARRSSEAGGVAGRSARGQVLVGWRITVFVFARVECSASLNKDSVLLPVAWCLVPPQPAGNTVPGH